MPIIYYIFKKGHIPTENYTINRKSFLISNLMSNKPNNYYYNETEINSKDPMKKKQILSF